MSKIIIVYASMSGNTEEIAEAIAAGLQEAGIEPVLKNVMGTNASELENYEGVLLETTVPRARSQIRSSTERFYLRKKRTGR